MEKNVQSPGEPVRSTDLIERGSPLSIRRQSKLLGIAHSRVYALQKGESDKDLKLMRVLNEFHIEDPSAGLRRMRSYLKRRGHGTFARSRIQRLMRLMGIEAAYPRKRTTIPMGLPRFMYLFAVLDWLSRKVIAWELSNTLETDFCICEFKKAVIETGTVPEIFNTDQGCQFTANDWINCLKDEYKVRITIDGKGRCVSVDAR